MSQVPTVTIIITARNRASELLLTLRQLKEQTYPKYSLLVFDDASNESLEPVVRSQYPEAIFVRNEKCQGLIANRSKAMKMARSEFLVSLDDDSCFTDRTDLAVAVKRMEAEPEIGVLTFLVYQGAKLAYPIQTPRLNEKYTCDFVGCAHMIRASVTTEVGVYRDFYYYYGEESEYSLRIWNAGWRILFFPKVIVHHRVSSAGRSNRKILRYSIRNNIWTTILHMPWPRVGIQLLWRFTNYGFESLRLLQPVAFVGAIASCVSGMPRVLRLRKPISGKTLELLDLISTKEVRTPAELSSKGPSLKDRITVFYASWKDRPRQRSFWDRRSGDLGKASTIVFEHQLDQEDRPLEGK